MNPYRHFFLLFLGLIAFNSLAITLINILADPYYLIGTQAIASVNELKPDSFKDARSFKAIKVMRIKPKTIVLGNSRTDIGINPDHPALTAHAPAYNLAIPAGTTYEAMRYFQHALANQPNLKQVVIGVDLVAFGQNLDTGENLTPAVEKLMNQTNYVPELPSFIFSTDTFNSSVTTIVSNVTHRPGREYYQSNGHLIRHNPTDRSTLTAFEQHLKTSYFGDSYQNYRISTKQLSYLKTIVDTCKAKGITLKVFISPAHVTQWEAIRTAGLWSTWEEWKREVAQITPVWDFSGYDSISTEAITDHMQNYLESSHYLKNVGDLVLDRMFDYEVERVPNDFGTLVTPENIESHLATIRAERQLWAKQNLEVVQMVEQWGQDVMNTKVAQP